MAHNYGMANKSKPISFHPLTLEQAVSGLLKVKPPAPKKQTKKSNVQKLARIVLVVTLNNRVLHQPSPDWVPMQRFAE